METYVTARPTEPNPTLQSARALGKARLGLHHGVVASEEDLWRERNNAKSVTVVRRKGTLHNEYD